MLQRLRDRKARSEEKIQSINRHGGLTYSMTTPECLSFFEENLIC